MTTFIQRENAVKTLLMLTKKYPAISAQNLVQHFEAKEITALDADLWERALDDLYNFDLERNLISNGAKCQQSWMKSHGQLKTS